MIIARQRDLVAISFQKREKKRPPIKFGGLFDGRNGITRERKLINSIWRICEQIKNQFHIQKKIEYSRKVCIPSKGILLFDYIVNPKTLFCNPQNEKANGKLPDNFFHTEKESLGEALYRKKTK